MTIETKLWDKEVLVPSLLFIVSIYLIIFYPLSYDINFSKSGVYLISLFFSSLFLFLITKELEFGRKFRIILFKDIYQKEYLKARALKDEFKGKKPYTHIYDKKFDQHMRDEIDKLDSEIALFTNLVLVLILLFIIDVISLVVFLSLSEVEISKLTFSILLLPLMLLLACRFRSICKRNVVTVNDIYIQHIKENEDDFT